MVSFFRIESTDSAAASDTGCGAGSSPEYRRRLEPLRECDHTDRETATEGATVETEIRLYAQPGRSTTAVDPEARDPLVEDQQHPGSPTELGDPLPAPSGGGITPRRVMRGSMIMAAILEAPAVRVASMRSMSQPGPCGSSCRRDRPCQNGPGAQGDACSPSSLRKNSLPVGCSTTAACARRASSWLRLNHHASGPGQDLLQGLREVDLLGHMHAVRHAVEEDLARPRRGRTGWHSPQWRHRTRRRSRRSRCCPRRRRERPAPSGPADGPRPGPAARAGGPPAQATRLVADPYFTRRFCAAGSRLLTFVLTLVLVSVEEETPTPRRAELPPVTGHGATLAEESTTDHASMQRVLRDRLVALRAPRTTRRLCHLHTRQYNLPTVGLG